MGCLFGGEENPVFHWRYTACLGMKTVLDGEFYSLISQAATGVFVIFAQAVGSVQLVPGRFCRIPLLICI